MTLEQGASIDTVDASASGEVTAPDGEEKARGPATVRRWIRRGLARWRSIVATAVVVAAVGLAAGLYFTLYRSDLQIDNGAAHRAAQAASDGAVAVLSYSPDNFDRDFATAKSHLTADFLAYYTEFADQFVKPMAQQKKITATATVIRSAVAELHPDSAVVLLFIDQSTSGPEKPEPVKTESSVLATLQKVDGSWLIAKFDPV